VPKIRRRCALCDDPLPDHNPTNTCQRCKDEEADHLARRNPLVDAFPPAPAPRPAPTVIEDEIVSVACPDCSKPIWNVTAICHPKNPIGSCVFGLEDRPHRHHFCVCGKEVVTLRPNRLIVVGAVS
jgi:hypothetical protein